MLVENLMDINIAFLLQSNLVQISNLLAKKKTAMTGSLSVVPKLISASHRTATSKV